MFTISKILQGLIDLVIVCKSILVELRAIKKIAGQRAPGLVFLKLVREENAMLIFKLALPPAADKDVLTGGKRTVVVAIGNGEPQTIDLPGDAIETDELTGNDNDTVVGALVDTDDAGNPSPARDFSFILVDTIAPVQPGEIGIQVIREE